MTDSARDDRPITWRTVLRNAVRFGLPFAGVAVIVHYGVASIGGEINRMGFALGACLIFGSFAARLIPAR